MKALIITAILALLGSPAFAGKEKLFNAEEVVVFMAAIEVAKEHYTIVAIDRDLLILSYRTPVGMRAATGYDVTVTFSPRPDGCAKDSAPACSQTLVRLVVAKRQAVFTWGGGDAATKDFFRWLGKKVAPKPDSKPPAVYSPPAFPPAPSRLWGNHEQ